MGITRLVDIGATQRVIADVGIDRFMDEMIAKLALGFREFKPAETTTMARAGFSYTEPDLGLVEWMPTMEAAGRVSIKTVGYHPTNPTKRNLPSVMATTSLHDTTTGQLIALTDATFLTAIRTGAASALATDELASLDATTLVVIGAGAQAVTQVHAISRIRTLTEVSVYDTDPLVAESFVRRLPVDVPVTIVPDRRELAKRLVQADVICTCTSVDPGEGPVLLEGDFDSALHINAVGADFPGKLELPRTLVDRALVIPDHAEQCLVEGEAQTLQQEDLGPELWELVAEGAHAHRNELTVFDSTGWAFEDLIAAELLLAHAERIGAGHEIELQPAPRDPYDPYEQVRPSGIGQIRPAS